MIKDVLPAHQRSSGKILRHTGIGSIGKCVFHAVDQIKSLLIRFTNSLKTFIKTCVSSSIATTGSKSETTMDLLTSTEYMEAYMVL